MAFVYGSTVVEQRCIFHKMRNVADKCREELKGEANKQTRKQLLEQVSVIIKLTTRRMPEFFWQSLLRPGEDEHRKPLPP